MGYSPWGHTESDMTELLGTHTPHPLQQHVSRLGPQSACIWIRISWCLA